MGVTLERRSEEKEMPRARLSPLPAASRPQGVAVGLPPCLWGSFPAQLACQQVTTQAGVSLSLQT